MYYSAETTQNDNTGHLGISPSKVNRLFQRARQQGMEEISLPPPFQHISSLGMSTAQDVMKLQTINQSD